MRNGKPGYCASGVIFRSTMFRVQCLLACVMSLMLFTASAAHAGGYERVSIPMDGGHLDGILFRPPGQGPFPAVVICPGGGYGGLAIDHEGKQVAEWLNSIGVAAFVLKYRLAPAYHEPAPMQDVNRAIRVVRSGASKWKVDPSRIGLLGFGGGFVDAVGGGGWGSIVLSALIAGGRNPRFSLGTVKLSRFFIAVMSSLTFVTMLNGIRWEAVSGLIIGSALASPIAAKVSNRISTKAIMVAVGVIVMLTSLRSIALFLLKVI